MENKSGALKNHGVGKHKHPANSRKGFSQFLNERGEKKESVMENSNNNPQNKTKQEMCRYKVGNFLSTIKTKNDNHYKYGILLIVQKNLYVNLMSLFSIAYIDYYYLKKTM